ncbi:hypothetical protein KKA95_03230 [Patescibacteria group bacterium]|nr:hypothetical protein [Patescibacteria group bacterium]
MTEENKVEKEELEKLVKKNGKKAVVIMTYNSVKGFPAGIHSEGRVVVYSWNRHAHRGDTPAIAKQLTDQFYDDFDLRRDGELFEHVFVYTGINAIDESIQTAQSIAHDWKTGDDETKVTMVGCECDYNRKSRIAHNNYQVDLIKCGCGGESVLGKIAQQIIEGVDPKKIRDYGEK